MSAFAGGMLAAVLLLGLVGLSRRRGMATFVLAGIVLNTLAQAAVMTVKFLADPERQLSTIEFWTMGSFSNVTAGKVCAAGSHVCFIPLFQCPDKGVTPCGFCGRLYFFVRG